jgi:hypothetical protein
VNRSAFFGFIIVALLTGSSNVTALQMGAGAKLGLSLGSLSGAKVDDMDTSFNPSMRLGLAGYGFLSVDILNNLGAQLEAGYVMKGKKWSNKQYDKTYSQTNFDYLEIPLLIKVMLPLGIVKPMLYAGPEFGILLSSKIHEHWEAPGFPITDTTYDFPDSSRSSSEFGLVLGGGTALDLGPGALVLDIRYTLGLSSIYKATESEKKEPGYKESDFEAKSGTVCIMVGYVFKF